MFELLLSPLLCSVLELLQLATNHIALSAVLLQHAVLLSVALFQICQPLKVLLVIVFAKLKLRAGLGNLPLQLPDTRRVACCHARTVGSSRAASARRGYLLPQQMVLRAQLREVPFEPHQPLAQLRHLA